MGTVIITLEILPESPDIDLDFIKEKSKEILENKEGKILDISVEPFVFGLKKIIIKFSYPEKEFNEEKILEEINSIEGVQSSNVINVTRALG